jgi:hypothetical protein
MSCLRYCIGLTIAGGSACPENEAQTRSLAESRVNAERFRDKMIIISGVRVLPFTWHFLHSSQALTCEKRRAQRSQRNTRYEGLLHERRGL